jgi:hypothetical protein
VLCLLGFVCLVLRVVSKYCHTASRFSSSIRRWDLRDGYLDQKGEIKKYYYKLQVPVILLLLACNHLVAEIQKPSMKPAYSGQQPDISVMITFFLEIQMNTLNRLSGNDALHPALNVLLATFLLLPTDWS